jgi:hypothetical protein
MERRILEGSVALLSEISSIQVELSAMSIYTDAFRLSDAQAWMADAGFTLSALFPNNKGHFPTLFETDALFIRSSLIKG